MKKAIVFGLLALLMVGCGNKANEDFAQDPPADPPLTRIRLKEAWATDTIFQTPESILYDSASNSLFVANINQNSWEKDGNGYISLVTLEGKMITRKWATGLSGPKGMGISGSSLFVTDIDELVEFSLATGDRVNSYTVEGEKPQLNDVAVGPNGSIFFSGSGAEAIFQLKQGEVSVFLDGNGNLGRPNGLLFQNKTLYMLGSNSGALSAIEITTKARKELASELGVGDGIVSLGENGFITSSWKGQVFHVAPSGEVTELLDTREQEINTADIEYVAHKNLLLIPTFYDNRIRAYTVEIPEIE